MQLIYRGVRVSAKTAAVKAARKPMGAYRGVPLSLNGEHKAVVNADGKQHHFKYRGVSYDH